MVAMATLLPTPVFKCPMQRSHSEPVHYNLLQLVRFFGDGSFGGGSLFGDGSFGAGEVWVKDFMCNQLN